MHRSSRRTGADPAWRPRPPSADRADRLHGVEDHVELALAPGAAGHEHDVIDPASGELATPVGERPCGLVLPEAAAEGDLDVVGVSPDVVACTGEDLELALQRGAPVRDVEQVAGVAVPGHQGQGAP